MDELVCTRLYAVVCPSDKVRIDVEGCEGRVEVGVMVGVARLVEEEER